MFAQERVGSWRDLILKGDKEKNFLISPSCHGAEDIITLVEMKDNFSGSEPDFLRARRRMGLPRLSLAFSSRTLLMRRRVDAHHPREPAAGRRVDLGVFAAARLDEERGRK
ncbi:MAG: hypothetical protein H5T72_04890 [Actinobacteria bacterium]|nr:hypothetical protein [Actinomycetota bacterium]